MERNRLRPRILIAILPVILTVILGLLMIPGSDHHTKAACAHRYTTDIPTSYVAPTCTSAGSVQVVCNTCGEKWTRESGKALGHDWDRSIATCTADKKCKRCGTVGQKAYGHHAKYQSATCTENNVCTSCNTVLEYAKGHSWNRSSASCTEDKKCNRCGKVDQKASGHNWYPATCTQDQKCTNCGATGSQKAFGHHAKYPSATCTEDNTCTSCGTVLEKATGHKWNRSSASCTEDRKCSRCGKVDQKALGHNWYPATCTEDQKCTRCGTTGSQKAFGHHAKYPSATCTEDNTCTSCGVVLEKATGHKWNRSSASCTEDKKCSKCGKVDQKATGHTWDRSIATCTEDQKCKTCGTVGQKAYGHHAKYPSATCTEDNICTSCSTVLEKATGHKWNRSSASCTEDKKCSKCGKVDQKATGHTWDRSIATCTEDQKCKTCGTVGQKAYGHHAKYPSATCTEDNTCTSCGTVLEKAYGHKWNLDAATCTEDRKCGRCGKIDQKALGHNWYPATCTEDQHCTRCAEKGTQKAFGHHAKYPSATCTEDNTCTSCGFVMEKATGHKWDIPEATCTKGQHCLKCGKAGEKQKGHDFTDPKNVTIVEPTCGKEGTKTVKCRWCSQTAGENIPPTNAHKWEEKERVLPQITQNGYLVERCHECGQERTTTLKTLGNLQANPSVLRFAEIAETRNVTIQNLYKDSSVEVWMDDVFSSWISISENGTSYDISVTENTSGSERTGAIVFKDPKYNRSIKVEVYQSDQPGCQITFRADGTNWTESVVRTVPRGSTMAGLFPEPPEAPDYYKFDAWCTRTGNNNGRGTSYNSGSIVPDASVLVLYAFWAPKEYSIVYDGNGATSGVMSRTKATNDIDATVSNSLFRKTGYVFDSWNTKKDGSGRKISEGEIVRNLAGPKAKDGATVTLYAQWAVEKQVKVSFDVNGGSDPNHKVSALSMTVIYKEPYGTLPELPVGVKAPTGKVFAGWEDSDHRLITAKSDVENNRDHILYAHWKDNSYKIVFLGNGNLSGSMDPITAEYDKKITMPKCGFDDGKGFEAWSTTPDGSGKVYTAGKSYDALAKTSEDTVTLYAVWVRKRYEVHYQDAFDSSKTIAVIPREKVDHVYYTKNDYESIKGLKFLGWSQDFGGMIKNRDRSKIIEPGKPVIFEPEKWSWFESSYRYLYPVYESSDTSKTAIIYHTNGGDSESYTEYVERQNGILWIPRPEDYDEETIPQRRGFEFTGWKDGIGHPVYSVELKKDTDEVHLYAGWIMQAGIALLLDHGDGSELEEVTPTTLGIYVLPGAKRDDYLFKGWKSEDGEIYKTGDELWNLPEVTILTAVWERRSYNIEFIDSETNKLIHSGTYLSDQRLDVTPGQIACGKEFLGWEYKTKQLEKDAKVSEFVDMKEPFAIALADLSKPYKLYTRYKGSAEDGKMMVYYHLNGAGATGGPVRPTEAKMTEDGIVITTSTAEPTWPGRKFQGWSIYPNGQSYWGPGEDIPYSFYVGVFTPVPEITLYAKWASEYKITLHKNSSDTTKPVTTEIKALPGDEIEMEKYKKFFGTPKGYTLLGWGITENEVAISWDGIFTVPEDNVDLYAIWNANTYNMRFLDAYGREIARRETRFGETFRICDLDLPRSDLEIPGYDLTGWSYVDPDRRARFTVGESEEISPTKELTYSPIYTVSDGIEGKLIIDYMTNGGVGGPGTVIYDDPKHCEIYVDLEHRPIREGYVFAGWSFYTGSSIGSNLDTYSYPTYPVEREQFYSGNAGDRIHLYAVWRRDGSVKINELQNDLDHEYGPGAIPSEKLLNNYISSDWEKMNDTTYYVIRTWRGSVVEDYESTVMVMQYSNGEWNLKAYGTLEGAWTNLRLNILTAHTNTSAVMLDHTFNVINTAAELGISFYYPPAKYIFAGIHFLSKAHEIVIQDTAYHDLYNAACEAADEMLLEELKDRTDLSDVVFGKALEYLLSSGNLSEKQVELYSELIVELFNETADALKHENDNMDPYGQYDYAFSLFKERVASQGFGPYVESRVYYAIDEIYKYINTHPSGY